MDLLRLSTVGSVDDGKSTLIGRLLYDSKGIFEDQLLAVEEASRRRGADGVNLALLTDGLRSERDLGITIDVAYRYFATPRRTFILADTPGHFQYTRNMVTGASTADVAVVLVDASRGVTEQSRRHAAIAALLRVPALLVCVNKMDLVQWAQPAFERIRGEVEAFVTRLGVGSVDYLPISALFGDNVVERSPRMPWYAGPALLERLETMPARASEPLRATRLPVQWLIEGGGSVGSGRAPMIRATGRLEGGRVARGDTLRSAATGAKARVVAVSVAARPIAVAVPPMSVTLELDPPIDLERGDLLFADPDDRAAPDDRADRADSGTSAPRSAADPPITAHTLIADVCWMSDVALAPGTSWLLKHTTRWVRATCSTIHRRYAVDTQNQHEAARSLTLNEIGSVEFRLDAPLFVDLYRQNRGTGSFIVVDETSNETVAAGMIVAAR